VRSALPLPDRWNVPSTRTSEIPYPAGCARVSPGSGAYAAQDQHAVVGLAARWGDEDLGALRRVEPPVRFGFSSVPASPSVTAVRVAIGPPA